MKTERRPIIDPLLLVLKSRRVLVALFTLIVSLLVTVVPEIQPMRGELITVLTTLALVLIGGFTVEDALAVGRGASTKPEQPNRDLIKELISEMIDAGLIQPANVKVTSVDLSTLAEPLKMPNSYSATSDTIP